jgi:dihydroxy-acid dehydratase
MWPMGAEVERGDLPRQDLETAQRNACPTCGACQFMGSASTGQVMAEALGLALPGSALTPAPLTRLLRYARATGKQLVTLIEENLTPRRILTRNAFENAIVLHAAVGGSTNALLHLPVIAREAGVDVGIDDFDRIHRRVPVLANVKTTGRYPVEYFWYAGGVPAVMLELREMLHLDCLTVTGKTVGENLDEIEQSPSFFAERLGYLRNLKIEKAEIIRPRDDPFGTDGLRHSTAVLSRSSRRATSSRSTFRSDGWRSSAPAVNASRRRPLTQCWPSAAASGSHRGAVMTPASCRCTNGWPGAPQKARRSHEGRIGDAAER